jgi:hypothetical protein
MDQTSDEPAEPGYTEDGLPIRDNPISRSSGRAPKSGHPRERSKVEEEGVPATDTEARSPLGVGRSEGRGGEKLSKDKESGRKPAGLTGKAERPAGKATGREHTGVRPSKTDTVNPHGDEN